MTIAMVMAIMTIVMAADAVVMIRADVTLAIMVPAVVIRTIAGAILVYIIAVVDLLLLRGALTPLKQR
jgi:hypothetical protein